MPLLDTDRDIQGRYPRGWREFDYLVSTATLRSFPDSLPQAREAQRRSTVVATFGRGTQRVEIRKVQGSPMWRRGQPTEYLRKGYRPSAAAVCLRGGSASRFRACAQAAPG